MYHILEPLLDFYRCYRTYTRHRLYRGTLSRYISAECRYFSPYQAEVSICAFQRIPRGISCSLYSFFPCHLPIDPHFLLPLPVVNLRCQTFVESHGCISGLEYRTSMGVMQCLLLRSIIFSFISFIPPIDVWLESFFMIYFSLIAFQELVMEMRFYFLA